MAADTWSELGRAIGFFARHLLIGSFRHGLGLAIKAEGVRAVIAPLSGAVMGYIGGTAESALNGDGAPVWWRPDRLWWVVGGILTVGFFRSMWREFLHVESEALEAEAARDAAREVSARLVDDHIWCDRKQADIRRLVAAKKAGMEILYGCDGSEDWHRRALLGWADSSAGLIEDLFGCGHRARFQHDLDLPIVLKAYHSVPGLMDGSGMLRRMLVRLQSIIDEETAALRSERSRRMAPAQTTRETEGSP